MRHFENADGFHLFVSFCRQKWECKIDQQANKCKCDHNELLQRCQDRPVTIQRGSCWPALSWFLTLSKLHITTIMWMGNHCSVWARGKKKAYRCQVNNCSYVGHIKSFARVWQTTLSQLAQLEDDSKLTVCMCQANIHNAICKSSTLQMGH